MTVSDERGLPYLSRLRAAFFDSLMPLPAIHHEIDDLRASAATLILLKMQILNTIDEMLAVVSELRPRLEMESPGQCAELSLVLDEISARVTQLNASLS